MWENYIFGRIWCYQESTAYASSNEEFWWTTEQEPGYDLWDHMYIKVRAHDGERWSQWGRLDYQHPWIPPVVCCFPAGTKISMADGKTKNIEEIKTNWS